MKTNEVRQAILCINPSPAGVWLVTRPTGGGGGQRSPPEISQTTGPISKFQTPFDSPVRQLQVQGQKFEPEVTDDVTGQVKVNIFDFSGLVTSASKISMLTANKANESAWIVSLTSVSIISCALWPWYRSRSSKVTRWKIKYLILEKKKQMWKM